MLMSSINSNCCTSLGIDTKSSEAQKNTVDARAGVIRFLEDERQALQLERQQFILTAEPRLLSVESMVEVKKILL